MDSYSVILGNKIKVEKNINHLINSIPKLSYVKNFPEIQNSTLTTDKGWGCTIRSCQMMLLYGYLFHFNILEKQNMFCNSTLYYKIIDNFNDNYISKLSIHSICFFGEKIDKKPGDWYGPNTISYIINTIYNCYQTILGIRLYYSNCSEINEKKVKKMLVKSPIFLLLPIKLGIDKIINKKYIEVLKEIISLKSSIGFIGGKRNSSYYIIGFNEERKKWIFFDPHKVRDYNHNDNLNSMEYGLLNYTDLDPNLAIGLYIKNEQDYNLFKNKIEKSNIFNFSYNDELKYKNLKLEEEWNLIY